MSAARHVLVFSPSGDASLAAAQAVAGWTARRLEDEGHQVDLRAGADAERLALAVLPDRHGLAAFAHGDEWSIFGHSREAALDRTNVSLLVGRWVWAFACRTADELGHHAIAAGARAWAGFEVAVLVDWDATDIPPAILADFTTLTSEPASRFAAERYDPTELRHRVRELAERILAELDDVDRHPDAVGLQLTVQQMIDRLRVLTPPA